MFGDSKQIPYKLISRFLQNLVILFQFVTLALGICFPCSFISIFYYLLLIVVRIVGQVLVVAR